MTDTRRPRRCSPGSTSSSPRSSASSGASSARMTGDPRDLHAVSHRCPQHAGRARLLPRERVLEARLHAGGAHGAHRTTPSVPMKLRRLEADVDPRNVNSCRILGKLGFSQREGLLRERWNVDGEIQDTAFLGLLGPGNGSERGRMSAITVVAVSPEVRRRFPPAEPRLDRASVHGRRRRTSRSSTIPERAIVAPGGMIFFALDRRCRSSARSR